jgi:hypothetical protein
VQTLQVRHRQNNEQYFTLSWVWGDTKIDRKEVFKDDGVHVVFERLPITIQDAITVTKELGESLLWVDAVCIDQDDKDDLQKQIYQMDGVYSLSVFTICAAAGTNGAAGLPGVRKGTRPLRQQQIVQAGNNNIFATPGGRLDFKTILNASPWRTRGWTFQEEFLSQRLLIFTEQEVLFRCKKNTGRETVVPPTQDLLRILHTGSSMFETDYDDTGVPGDGWSFDFYRGLVHKYLQRRLTYKEDTLHAFQGLGNMIYNIQGVRFRSGLPETDVLNGLMWVHDGSPTLVARKKLFSSWSWAEWEGPLEYYYPSNSMSWDICCRFWRVLPRIFAAFTPRDPCSPHLLKGDPKTGTLLLQSSFLF